MGFKQFFIEENFREIFFESLPVGKSARKSIFRGGGKRIGVHFGDGGIGRDTIDKEMGGGRGTGHFGTGTYYYSPENEYAKSKSTGNPRIELNLDDLNMYNLKDFSDSQPNDGDASDRLGSTGKFHELLRYFNSALRISRIKGIPLDWKNRKEEWFNHSFDPKMIDALAHYIPQPKEKIREVVQKVSDLYISRKSDGIRTPATLIMQGLGYDGIDVRGTDKDKRSHGSVVYPRAEDLEGNTYAKRTDEPPIFDGTRENKIMHMSKDPNISLKYAKAKGFKGVDPRIMDSISRNPEVSEKYVEEVGGVSKMDLERDSSIFSNNYKIAYKYANDVLDFENMNFKDHGVLLQHPEVSARYASLSHYTGEEVDPRVYNTIAEDPFEAFTYLSDCNSHHNMTFKDLPKVIQQSIYRGFEEGILDDEDREYFSRLS